MNSKRHNNRTRPAFGFTLIELLVVLVILGMLASLAGPRVIKYLGESKTKTSRLQIAEFGVAVDLYHLDVGRYPNTEQGLQSLVEQPADVDTWNGPYLKKKNVPKDPWGYDYHYESPSEQGAYAMYSLGADNAESGTGENQDIKGWE